MVHFRNFSLFLTHSLNGVFSPFLNQNAPKSKRALIGRTHLLRLRYLFSFSEEKKKSMEEREEKTERKKSDLGKSREIEKKKISF